MKGHQQHFLRTAIIQSCDTRSWQRFTVDNQINNQEMVSSVLSIIHPERRAVVFLSSSLSSHSINVADIFLSHCLSCCTHGQRGWTISPLILVSLTHFDTLLLVFSFLFDVKGGDKKSIVSDVNVQKNIRTWQVIAGKHFLARRRGNSILSSLRASLTKYDVLFFFNKNSSRSFIIISSADGSGGEKTEGRWQEKA